MRSDIALNTVATINEGAAVPKDPRLKTISVNLPKALVNRVRALGHNQELSASSIIEKSLAAFLEGSSDDQSASRLRILGASLRRSGN